MSDFKLNISLYTPASDIVIGGNSSFEALFGRGGNDTFYGDLGNDSTNIDFWFGDVFDNSPEEYEVVLGIQEGNPLLILEKDIPSVGGDRFILGDETQPYYANTDTADKLLTTNFLGLNEYVVIYDFGTSEDVIRLNGNEADYRIVPINGLKVEGVDQLFYGKAIFSVQQGYPDLIAYVISKPEEVLDFKGEYFQFVGEKPKKKPEQKLINQLGTTAVELGLAAATDPSGNFYATGYTTGPLAGNHNGSTDIWIVKFNNNGNQLWAKQFGTAGSDNPYSIVTDKDGNFYVAGDTGGSLFSTKQSDELDIWVAKYDSNGNLLWGKQFGTDVTAGYSNSSFGLDVDEGGNVYLSGLSIKENTRRDIFNFSIQDDSWITKLDSNGNQEWFTQIGKNTPLGNFVFDETYDVAVDKNGNTYATGWTQGLIKESDPSRNLLKYDAWLAKVNPAGEVEWIQQFGSTDEGLEAGWTVDTDSLGNIYVTGWTSGSIGTANKDKTGSNDIWLSKFSPDGTQLWTKQFGSEGDDGTYLADIVIDSQDNIFLTGYSDEDSSADTYKQTVNAFVAKFDTNGNNKWVQEFGSKYNLTYATGVTTDNNGKLFVTGYTDSLLGDTSTESTNSTVDAWVATLDTNKGNVQNFIGDSNDVIGITDPTAIFTVDISSTFVTDELLPSGDNLINPNEGISTSSSFSYGQITSNLGNIFDPVNQNSFTSVLSQGVSTGNASFLSSDDLNFLQG